MKDLKPQRGDKILKQLIGEGEHENLDFKFTVNDPRKIARSISAFANHSGGRLLIGVDDNGVLKGVRNEEDIYVVEAAAQMYCEPSCPIEFKAYKAQGGAIIISAEIESSKKRPIYVKEESGKKIAYYRVADENIHAHPLMIQAWKYNNDNTRSTIINLNSGHSHVLKILEECFFSPDELLKRLTISTSTFNQIISQLYGMNLIDFIFEEREFKISLK